MNLIAAVTAVADTDWNNMMGSNWNHMSNWGVGNWLLMAAFWAILILGVVWLVGQFANPRHGRQQTASELLKRRLASGEISVEEYEERSEAIQHTAHRPSPS
jgi:uncharacterized membrane protein